MVKFHKLEANDQSRDIVDVLIAIFVYTHAIRNTSFNYDLVFLHEAQQVLLAHREAQKTNKNTLIFFSFI